MTTAAIALPVPDAPLGVPCPVVAPGHRFLLGWTAARLAVGVVVAARISFGAGVDFLPVLRLSALSAVVGYSAYTSARVVSPLLARLPGGLRLTLDSLIVVAGTVFGSIVVFLTDPFFTLAQFRTVLLILALNALLAAGVAVALGAYDRMRRQYRGVLPRATGTGRAGTRAERRPRGPARAAPSPTSGGCSGSPPPGWASAPWWSPAASIWTCGPARRRRRPRSGRSTLVKPRARHPNW